MPDYNFGPHNVADCQDYSYTCSSEQCLEDSFSSSPTCECAPGFFRDCSCRCNALDESSFYFQTDCGCTNGSAYETLGTCETECPASAGDFYCPPPYGSELQCPTIPDDDEDGDPIDGADIPKPSIDKKWIFQVSTNSYDNPIDIPIDFGDTLSPGGPFDVSNIFYADLHITSNVNIGYTLYAVVNGQVRGISSLVDTNGVSYHYLEVKWQQTQEQGNTITLYAKDASNNVYLVDEITNPLGESIGSISTLITSLSWYS